MIKNNETEQQQQKNEIFSVNNLLIFISNQHNVDLCSLTIVCLWSYCLFAMTDEYKIFPSPQ